RLHRDRSAQPQIRLGARPLFRRRLRLCRSVHADGKFISGDSGKVWQGRKQLAEAAGGNGHGCPFPKMPLEHIVANLVIEATPDGAKGKSYLIYPGRNGKYVDDQHHGHDGGYQDIYVKTADGWRFKERVHVYPPQIPGSYAGVPNSKLPAAAFAKPQ